MKCVKCNEIFPDTEEFCPHCGDQTDESRKAEAERKKQEELKRKKREEEEAERKRQEAKRQAELKKKKKRRAVIRGIVIALVLIVGGFCALGYYSATAYSRTATDYDAQIAQNPSNPDLYLRRAYTHLDYSAFDKAKLDLLKALELNPALAAAIEKQADSYVSAGGNDKAVFLYTVLIEKTPGSALYEKRADVQAILDWKAAYSDYSRALEFTPDNFGIIQKRGDLAFKNDDFSRAESDYSKLIESSHASAGVYINRGKAYESMEDYERAIGDYSAALLDTGINNAEKYAALFRRGGLYSDSGQYNEAAADYSSLLENFGDDIDIFEKRGDAYYYAENYNNAVSDYSRALSIKSSRGLLISRATAYFALTQYDKGIEDLSKIIKDNKNDDYALALRGRFYWAIDSNGKAVDDLDKAIKIDPSDDTYYAWRADAHMDKGAGALLFSSGDYKKAVADYSKAIEIEPNNANYYASRGKVYFAQEDYRRALNDFDEAIKRDGTLAAGLAEFRNECLKH